MYTKADDNVNVRAIINYSDGKIEFMDRTSIEYYTHSTVLTVNFAGDILLANEC